MKFNGMEWFDSSILIFMAMSFILNALVAYIWDKKFYRYIGLKKYKAIQRIHLNETPRLGGFIFLISLFGYALYCNSNEITLLLKIMFISLAPVILFGIKEDLFHNVEPAIRLMALLLAAWLFKAQYSGPIPYLSDIPIINKLFILQGGTSFFYILSMVAIANGMNLIDGVNGLCGAVVSTILSALLFLSYKTNDIVMLPIFFSLFLLLIPFILFNYPFGKIFLGDLGAYSLGLVLSMLTIIFFGRHPEISPWGAVLILIYPATEVVLSIVRRTVKGVSIYHPDKAHLHLKLFLFLRPISAFKRKANALVTPILCALWILPLLGIFWAYHNVFYIICFIFLFVSFYLLIYISIPKLNAPARK